MINRLLFPLTVFIGIVACFGLFLPGIQTKIVTEKVLTLQDPEAGFLGANTFPTSLNTWSAGETISSAWANALEAKIGADSSAVSSSHDYKISALETSVSNLEATTTMGLVTSLPNLATVGTITSGTWNGTTIAVNKGGTGKTAWTDRLYPIVYDGSTLAQAPSGIVTSQILDTWTSPNTIVTFTTGGVSAANWIDFKAANANIAPIISTAGSDTNVNLTVDTKGTATTTITDNFAVTGTSSLNVLCLNADTCRSTWPTGDITQAYASSTYLTLADHYSTTTPVIRGGTGLTSIAEGSILAANTANTLTAVNSTTGTRFLKNAGGAISWLAASGVATSFLDGSGAFSLPTGTNGGTGLTSFTNGSILYASAANTWSALASSTPGKVLKISSSGYPAWEDDANTTYTAGDHITLTGTDFDVDAELYTACFSLAITGVSATSSAAQKELPSAFTVTSVDCSTDQGSSTIMIDERVKTTPNTGGTDILSAALVCDTDNQNTTSFANAGIAAGALINVDVDAINGSPYKTRLHVCGTYDD